MYFEKLNDSDGSVSIHMSVYNEDDKCRRVVGCSVDSPEELNHKIDVMIAELEVGRKQGVRHFNKNKQRKELWY